MFDVEASASLTERQKRRVVAKAGPVVRAVAQDERSQARNRELAVERLVAKLAAALLSSAAAGRPRRPSPRASAGSSRSGAAPP